jgi:hypothetical protein
MYGLTRTFSLLWMVAFGCLASCGLDEDAAALDARQVYGCYTAGGAPWFTLGASGMRVEGSSAPVPFRYEGMKVGPVVAVRLQATNSDGRLSFVPSAEESFYRRAPFSNPAVVIVAFGSGGMVVNYRRSEDARCGR